MPKGSQTLTNARKEEIINACAELYKTTSFKDITIKEIGNVTSFTRTSIYNYFQTKEEIFLSLLKREYEYWTQDLNIIINSGDIMSKAELAGALAHSLEKRTNMLKLMAMNLYDIEENSRMEQLVEFKKVYGGSVVAMQKCVDKFCTDMSQTEKKNFISLFFPFVYGIYPYAFATDKQQKAMECAKIECKHMSVYDIAFMGTKRLLGAE